MITADDPALMIDTSGTTGRSKGALLTHHNLVSNIVTLLQCWQWTAADRFLLALPMFHIHGLGNGLHGALASGCTTFLLPRFALTAVCDVRNERVELLGARAGNVEKLNDYRTLLPRGDIDAVILALHPEHSIDIAIEFLRNNKGVLDEKPLAVTLEDGRRLADVVAQSSSPYQIGFVFRYCETVRRIAEFADRIGSPAIYSSAFSTSFWIGRTPNITTGCSKSSGKARQ